MRCFWVTSNSTSHTRWMYDYIIYCKQTHTHSRHCHCQWINRGETTETEPKTTSNHSKYIYMLQETRFQFSFPLALSIRFSSSSSNTHTCWSTANVDPLLACTHAKHALATHKTIDYWRVLSYLLVRYTNFIRYYDVNLGAKRYFTACVRQKPKRKRKKNK